MCTENKVSSQGIHYLRYMMSWLNAGGDFDSDHYWDYKFTGENRWKGYHGFRKWLESINLPEEEIKDIMSMTGMGKLELEGSAREFLKNGGIKPNDDEES